ncbi:zonadhesin-like isoform X2 [Arctopsyche grandis]|uniref:zonadhesin-like isoform X2 n=1 Tax=Arctopsyche grandis TaxID=121162 RepID=UPI00406D7885
MLNNNLIKCILLLLVSSIYCFDDEKCRPNEEYLTCGLACQPTCSNYMDDVSCHKHCVKGCFCKPGYVRNTKFRCVLPEHCFLVDDPPKPKCKGYNEEFNDCGSACPDTCDNYMIQHNCTRQCKKGCFCKAGYVRDEDWFCVLPKDCPPAVPPLPVCKKQNETYTVCGSNCPQTCANYEKPKRCSKICVPGCFCKKGYVKNYNNTCVLIKECPPRTAIPYVSDGSIPVCPNVLEEYVACGAGYQQSCDNMNTTAFYDNKCVEGCYCKTGFVRDRKGNCILPKYCPLPTSSNCRYLETPATRWYNCVGTCDEPDECEPAPIDSCVCMKGTLRDNFGQCVYPEFCPIGCYGLNEVFDCGSPCDTKCKSLGKPCNIRAYECVKQCYCKDGYARDHRDRCVPIKYCPRKTPKANIFAPKAATKALPIFVPPTTPKPVTSYRQRNYEWKYI